MKHALVFLLALASAVEAAIPQARSVSSSKQFTVYCDDAALRGRVVGFVEEVKSGLLELLAEPDRAKSPIIITLGRAPTARAVPVRLHAFEGPGGSTIEIDVQIGDDPAAVHLRKHIVRALLLELTYRDRGGIKGDQRYVEAPWWLVEGALQILSRRDLGVEPELFQRLLETNKFPPLDEFLRLQDGNPGATAQSIDEACAMCLLELLIQQPNGRGNLGRLIRHWPDLHEDAAAALVKEFPGLGQDSGGLQKWWTLSLASFAVADRYRGLSAEQTDKELRALLEFEVVSNKKGDKKKFGIAEFDEFVKLPGCKLAMAGSQAGLVRLSTRANAILRPVVAEYEKVFALLARRRTRGVAERIVRIERYRDAVLHRMGEVSDYLNWYEATQFGTRSNAFDSFLKTAAQLSTDEANSRRSDPVAAYLDQLQEEF